MAADRHESKYKASQAIKDAMEKELGELEARISRLRVLYDQYFMGIEKMEPTYLRGEVEKIFRRSQILKRGSTALKFRFRSLQQRYTSYRSYWDRIVRMIEDGQIRRGINMLSTRLPSEAIIAKEYEEQRTSDGPQESLASRRRRFRRRDAQESKEALGDAVAAATKQLSGGAQQPERCEFSPKETRALFDCLMREKKKAGQDTSRLTPGVVEKSVTRILSKVSGDKKIQFRVVAKDGDVSLKAVVKKDGS